MNVPQFQGHQRVAPKQTSMANFLLENRLSEITLLAPWGRREVASKESLSKETQSRAWDIYADGRDQYLLSSYSVLCLLCVKDLHTRPTYPSGLSLILCCGLNRNPSKFRH